MKSRNFQIVVALLFSGGQFGCTDNSTRKTLASDPPTGTVEYCIKHAERVGTFYEGIKHFGTLSPNMPAEYRACLEDKTKRDAALKEYSRLMAEIEKSRKETAAKEKKQAKKDQALIKSIRGEL